MRTLLSLLALTLCGCPASHGTGEDAGESAHDATDPGPDGGGPTLDAGSSLDADASVPWTPTDAGPRVEPPPGVTVCFAEICDAGEICCFLDARCIAPGDPSCAVPPGSDPGTCASTADCAPGRVCVPEAVPGSCSGLGLCLPPPSVAECPDSSEEVCGCDGRTYPGSCAALRAGVRVSALAACGSADVPGVGHQYCESDADCGPPGWAHAYCDTSVPTCRPIDPPIVCGIDAQCPDASACCGITGRCYDPTHPALCTVPPEGTVAPCETDEDCARVDGSYWSPLMAPQLFCDGPSCAGPGGCRRLPPSCDGVLAPVCGCDATSYQNACEAERAGVRVAHEGAC